MGALLKLPFFTIDKKMKFPANLYLTFHSWSHSPFFAYVFFFKHYKFVLCVPKYQVPAALTNMEYL